MGAEADKSGGADPARWAARAFTRIRYRFWRWAVYLLLTVVGVLNIYPFLWMLGTSFKSTTEASTDRGRPLPLMKYHLTQSARDAAAPPAGVMGRRRQLLADLRAEDDKRREMAVTFVATSTTADEYARKHKLAGVASRRELEAMVSAGLLERGRVVPENYRIVWTDMRFGMHFLTTVVLAAAVVLLTVAMTAMGGYALARMRFPGRGAFLVLLIIGAVAPRDATFLPIFRMLHGTALLEGLWGIVLWLASTGIRSTLLMTAFFLAIPREVEEAAAIDGAGTFRTFFDIALPMARPIVVTVAFLSFLGAWNQFLIPFICTISRPTMQPLAVAIFSFQRGHLGLWEQINAASAIMIVPLIVPFLIFQRYIVKSIAIGAVKG